MMPSFSGRRSSPAPSFQSLTRNNLDVAPFNRQTLPVALDRGDDEQARFTRYAEPDGERSVAADSNAPRHRVRADDDINAAHATSSQEAIAENVDRIPGCGD